MPLETAESVIKRVARRIAELRATREITQEHLAEKLDCSVQWIARVEAGENLSLTSLVKIARGLGVTTADLLAPPSTFEKHSTRGRPRRARSKS